MDTIAVKRVENVSDAIVLGAIRNECLKNMTRNQQYITVIKQTEFYQKNDSRWSLFLFHLSGNPIGYGTLFTDNEKSWISGGLVKECREEGFGTELFMFLRDLNSTSFLEVFQGNEVAIHVYEKLNFKEINRKNNIITMKYDSSL